ncbi:DUF5403 family protein [Streptomyces albulus]|nr:DUF5403 family protein [Streptomyces noursei]
MATVKPNTDSIVAHLRGVRDAVADELDQRADRVRAVVEAHRHTGPWRPTPGSARTGRTPR